MTQKEINQINNIKNSYCPQEESKLQQLKALDSKVSRPAKIFAYVFGSIGSLVLGTGMCFAMKVIGATLPYTMPFGIAIGILGIIMVSANYSIYTRKLAKRKRKYEKQILALSNELLNY